MRRTVPSVEEEESPAAEVPAAAEDSSDSVGGAIDSIFGAEDDLPEESGLFQKSADASMNLTGDAPAEETLDLVEPAVEPAADLELPAEESAAEWTAAPAAEPATESEEKPVEEPATDLEMPAEENKEVESSVDNAFSSIFGEDDDLPQDDLALGESPAAAAVEPVEEKAPAEEPAVDAESFSKTAGDFEKEMGGAFDSLFGSDEENTGAAVEEKNIPSESLEAGLDKSFDSLFGEEKEEPVAETPVEDVKTEAPAQKTDFDNLESEVSGAFKGLFESDDDDLPEEKPSNKGVDFLMSGDSDDEVSAGLIKDPSATLDNVNAGLDESLNTRTLAEIYLEQGLSDKALEIYQDLAKKEPDNAEIQERLEQVRKIYNDKFGG